MKTPSQDINNYIKGLIFILFPWLTVLLLRDIDIIIYPKLSAQFALYITLFVSVTILFYSFSFYMCSSDSKKTINSNDISADLQNFMKYSSILYAVLACISYFYIGHGGLSLKSLIAYRAAANIHGPRNSLIGGLRTLFAGAPPIYLSLLIQRAHQKALIPQYLIVLLGIACMFLSGGRNSFFISIVYVLMFNFLFVGRKLNLRNIYHVIILLMFVGAFIFSMEIFAARLVDTGVKGGIIHHLESDYHVVVTKSQFKSAKINQIYSIAVYLLFYITHALNYMNSYFVDNYSPLFLGGYSLPDAARFVDIMLGTHYFQSAQSGLLLRGVYLTYPGALYLDFGKWGGYILTALLSIAYGRFMRNLKRLDFFQQSLCVYIIVCLIFSPIYPVIGIGNGFSLLVLIFITRLSKIADSKCVH